MSKIQSFLFSTLLIMTLCCHRLPAADFQSDFGNTHDRIWVGKDYWANPMEDWKVENGRLECISPGANRNVHLLTRQLTKKKGTLTASVTLGRLGKGNGTAGFRIGIHDKEIDDYRRWLIYGNGINAGVTTDGLLFIGNKKSKGGIPVGQLNKGITLELTARPDKKGNSYTLTLSAKKTGDAKPITSLAKESLSADQLYGNLAIGSNLTKKRGGGKGSRFWFKNWTVSGSKVEANGDRAFGPILWTMYTLSRGTLKLNAMMPPIGPKEMQTVRLQINAGKEKWKTIATAKIDKNARTAIFKVQNWNGKKDIPYRVAYTQVKKDGSKTEAYYAGTIRKDPVDKKSIVVAGFTGNADYGFPNNHLVKNVTFHNPDILFFSGDQIYEYVGGYGIIRFPAARAILNYLRKWWLVGLAFGDLMRDRPTVAIPDDHDVYQGNIWGNGGNPVSLRKHASGGYVEPPEMVNVVHKTQCGNLPDPFDPTPIKQNISVYYTDMLYGRVSFAVIADRMFKSGPEGNVSTWKGRPDHIKDPHIDVAKLDKKGLKYLGDRQLKFLHHWAADWKGVDMQCVLSQTIFCNLANYHGAGRMYLVADLDSGGWPQSGRNRALDAIRRGFGFHYAGDQHLASIVHHGIDEPADACFSFCVPSIANFYPRRWIPDEEGKKFKNREITKLPNTGDYIDGLGNHIRVYAIGNPKEKYRRGRLESLHDKASGYGIVRFNRKKQTITMECYKLLVDVSDGKKTNQFPGWPMTIHMTENYGRKAVSHLPTIRVKGMNNPVVQVIDEKAKEIVYTLRIRGNEFQPKVFREGRYTVKVGEPGTKNMQVLKGIQSELKSKKVLDITFQ